jgi:polar amino acid transport system substrate-binding protein
VRADPSTRGRRISRQRAVRATLLPLISLAAALGLVACSSTPRDASTAVAVPSPSPSVSIAAPGTAGPGPVAPVDLSTCVQVNPPLSPMPRADAMPGDSIMRQIQQRGYLLAGVDQDEYDLDFRNPSPGPLAPAQEFEGYETDILRAVAHAIFGDTGNPESDIEFVPVSQDYRMGAANQGIVDIVADSISMTCDRAQQVGFSADYFIAHQELLVDRDNDTADVTLNARGVAQVVGLRGQKVCTVGGTTSIGTITAQEKQGGFTTVIAENWSDCLVLLQQGDVQAVTTDNNLLGGFKAEDPYLKIVGQPMSDETHALAIPRSYPDLSAQESQFLSFINGVLAQLESSAPGWCPQTRLPTDASCWAALYRVWIEPGLGGTPPSPPPLLSYP